RPAVPHWERRCLDEVSQRIERALGLAQPERKRLHLFVACARVEEPAQQASGGFRGRRRAPAALEHPGRAVGMHLARQTASGDASRLDVRLERLEIVGSYSAVVNDQLQESLRLRAKAKVAQQLRIDLDAKVRPDEKRP